ncbi:GNAT family N-acetyltransferase [Vibrio tapetis subsp. quintayensis]|uniref:GNAT family N-acetyltransferase n=1 Tax=Vibrio tapetis TaxID=52443 RepID=UPI0025B40B16|nr:GNAT family N-acetyltransferase [Vibrio tapetis]MDN3680236.1 GNAT family N-acetyltransferase [Vibrio tapetis subsp. quintayensis]
MAEITIRHSEPNDAVAIKEVYSGELAYSGTLQLPFPPVSSWEKRVGNIPDNVYSFVAEINGEVVGNLGVSVCINMRRRHVAEFGMGVKDEFQGQGVGSALLAALIELTDNWLNIRRLELTVFVDNKSAQALYKKFGFEIEGESKDYAFRNGQYVDVYHMARINTVS